MRLWHTQFLPFLPKSQLLAQWRELNSIFVKEDRHILINYIYDYPKNELKSYTTLVIRELIARGVTIRTYDKMTQYFLDTPEDGPNFPFQKHHDRMYATICYYNLYEKYMRGQKDFSREQFDALTKFYTENM